jgi:hypothetical protein
MAAAAPNKPAIFLSMKISGGLQRGIISAECVEVYAKVTARLWHCARAGLFGIGPKPEMNGYSESEAGLAEQRLGHRSEG